MAKAGPIQVGILGAGQLGRMLALAGYPLDVRCVLLDPSADAPAGQLAEHLVAAYDDTQALERLAACDVVTYEFENVPATTAEWLAERVPVYPPPKALHVARDRWREKTCFRDLGIPTPRFANASTLAELEAAVRDLGLPCVLKTRSLGYDGKGQAVIRTDADVEPAFRALQGVPLIVEEWVRFERELSIIAVRSATGQTAYYPLIQNEHRGGVLHLSQTPAPNVTPELQAAAESYVAKLLDELAYVGVLTLELFDVSGHLLANEIAPRVHNSGHFSIEGAETSQFENHLRAIIALPLGPTTTRGYAAMVNLVGTIPDRAALLAIPGAHVHLYGKEPRKGRKVGHVTLVCDTAEQRCERIDAVLRAIAAHSP